ncbi:MAG: RluA family pseudouridine synthase [Rhizobiaceae bacterium]|nr:RluA family pseudouridine synthase [Rhizobiaceae bacterium]
MSQTDSPYSGERKELIVEETSRGARFDAWLTAQMPSHISRSRIKSLIKQGNVSLGDVVATDPSLRLKGGEKVELVVPEPEDAIPKAENIPLDILHEDEHLIVINKPAGMVVHPAVGNWSGTLVNALLYHCKGSLAGIGGVRRPGIVHRLDKETSGVMVVAKTDLAHAGLSAQFADHGKTGSLERAYLALVWGVTPRKIGLIRAPLGRSSTNRIKRKVVREDAPDARHAVTHYTLIKALGGKENHESDISLVECRLETGRTHQIRVHMAHIGHPLVGDQVYGQSFQTKINKLTEPQKILVNKLRRQALHAALLGFDHPATGEAMQFVTDPPKDMIKLLAAFPKGWPIKMPSHK